MRFLPEDVKRRLAEVLDVPNNDGDYQHVAKLLGFTTDQQMVGCLQGMFVIMWPSGAGIGPEI